jgi:hypothetical protein
MGKKAPVMDVWDLTNAFFEAVGSVLIWLNVRRLYIDREVKGVQWEVNLFWLSWGVFNLFFYGPVMGLWISWWMGISIIVANTVWVAMLLYFMAGSNELCRYRHRWTYWQVAGERLRTCRTCGKKQFHRCGKWQPPEDWETVEVIT